MSPMLADLISSSTDHESHSTFELSIMNDPKTDRGGLARHAPEVLKNVSRPKPLAEAIDALPSKGLAAVADVLPSESGFRQGAEIVLQSTPLAEAFAELVADDR